MTSLLVWFAADKKKDTDFEPASVYIATDSLITWHDDASWAHGKKVYAASTSPDIFAYCGDRLFAAHVLSHVVSAIDAGYLYSKTDSALGRMHNVQQVLRMLWDSYPEKHKDDADIVHVTRDGEGVGCAFTYRRHSFKRGKVPTSSEAARAPSGQVSAPLLALGTGKTAVESSIDEWNSRYQNRHTSRAVFAAFCESLAEHKDKRSGGAPQLVGLYRIGAGRSFGVIWNDHRYFDGLPTVSRANKSAVPWRNNSFEIADQARRLPANNQLLRPMAIGRIWFSTQLLSAGRSPSSR